MCLINALKYCKGIYARFVNKSCKISYLIISNASIYAEKYQKSLKIRG